MDACWLDRLATRAPGMVAVDEVVRFTGLPQGEITDLVRTGVLEGAASTKTPGITVTSIRSWLSMRP